MMGPLMVMVIITIRAVIRANLHYVFFVLNSALRMPAVRSFTSGKRCFFGCATVLFLNHDPGAFQGDWFWRWWQGRLTSAVCDNRMRR